MKTYEVVGAIYDGEILCLKCALPEDIHESPIFAGDEDIDDYYCGECHEKLVD